MKLYSRIALGNLKKNSRFFVPRILTEAGLMACYYIIMTLARDRRMSGVYAGSYISVTMGMGLLVMTILSFVLMLYTNSFLMKQRRGEFGVYSILGMEKRHVGRVLFYEMTFSGLAGILLGAVLGLVFYKLATLLVCRILNAPVVNGFYYVNLTTVLPPALFFLATDALTYIFDRISIARMKPVELLRSRSAGEKEPKVKWVLLVIGLATLGYGYYLSLSVSNPMDALIVFFIAVILVMIGTYCLFVTGSIWVLRLMKRNEKFYYSARRMPAVSGLLYRMKQNAVGLASIAILATGVLVMISTTVSLYTGMQETLSQHYPHHYYVNANYTAGGREYTADTDAIAAIVEEKAEEAGLKIARLDQQKYLEVNYNLVGSTLCTDRRSLNLASNLAGLTCITWMTEENYRALGGEKLDLKPDEAALCPLDAAKGWKLPSLTAGDTELKITRLLPTYPISIGLTASVNCYGMVVADQSVLDRIYAHQLAAYGDNASGWRNLISVVFTDQAAAEAAGPALDDAVRFACGDYMRAESGVSDIRLHSNDSIWEARENVLAMYGTFLFLGILLGLVCLFATVLIIYYKQLSEGYEDRGRFQIMQKIGMSAQEVRRTINTQVLIVFFLPLIVAGVHMLFAYPLLQKLLQLLMLSRADLFVECSVITYLVFAAVYTLIYSRTAKTYYKIVK